MTNKDQSHPPPPPPPDPASTEVEPDDPMLTQPIGLDRLGSRSLGLDPVGSQPSGPDALGSQPSGLNPIGSQPSGPDALGSQPSGLNPAGSMPTGPQAVVDTEHAGDPAFADGPTDSATQRVAAVPPEVEEERGSSSKSGLDVARLAVVVLGLFPLLGYLFFTYALPSSSSSSPTSSAPAAPPPGPSSYPEVPFRTTTDRPMTDAEIDRWLSEKPTKKIDRLETLSEVSAQAKPENKDEQRLAPGQLYDPDRRETVAVKPAKATQVSKQVQQTPQAQGGGFGIPNPFDTLRKARKKQAPSFIYQEGKIENSDVFKTAEGSETSANGAKLLPLEVGDTFEVRLHSGLSSVARDNVVLVRVTDAVRKHGRILIPKNAIIRGSIRTYGQRRFFLSFGEVMVGGQAYRFEGRAEERHYSGIVAVRREATFEERQRSTIINGVVSGLVGATAVASQTLPPGVREASQVIANGTRQNTVRQGRVQTGFVLEAAKGKRFRILVTR